MVELPDELLRTVVPELLLTVPSAEELVLLTEVPEALLLERVLPVEALLLERVLCWLLPEVLLTEVEEEPEEERVTCWLLPEVLLVEEAEEPEVERLTCWLAEELERDTVAAELEREAEEELDRETEEPELERVD